MSTLDSSIVNIALPTISKQFSVGLPQVKWVVMIYLLAITVLLLPFGRLADQYGKKLMLQTGFAIFTLHGNFEMVGGNACRVVIESQHGCVQYSIANLTTGQLAAGCNVFE